MFALTCPLCRTEITLSARRLLVRIDDESATSGELLFTCLNCHLTPAARVDLPSVAALLSGGVTHLSLTAPAWWQQHGEAEDEAARPER